MQFLELTRLAGAWLVCPENDDARRRPAVLCRGCRRALCA